MLNRVAVANSLAMLSAVLYALFAFVASVGPAVGQPATTTLVESYLIPSGDPGIQLYVRNKRPGAMTTFRVDRTVLYVHGTTQASETTFDLALGGKSWMDDLAEHGWDVWLMDVRGYGGSTKPPEMDRPPAESSPIAPAPVAARDLRTVVEHILGKRGLPRISLIGWSRGSALVGGYASENPDKVHRLVLYAPGWIRTPGPSAATPALIPAYQSWTMQQARERLQAGAPPGRAQTLMPAAWFDAWTAAAQATDPIGATRTPPVVRTPAGSLQDAQEYWNAGKALYDPSRITAPTLIVTAEWDGLNPPTSGQALFEKLTNAAEKRLVEIGQATHLVMLEKNRGQLFREVRLFLDEPRPEP
jgi:pimeloyl-ACP methyl ester carboxylesterase